MSTSTHRRDSVQTGSRERTRSTTPEPPPKIRRPSADLGAMLKPTNIPKDKYYAVQSVLMAQDKLITDRGSEIKDRCKQISLLHKDIKDANARIDRDQDRLARKTSEIAALEKKLVQAKKEKDGTVIELRNNKRSFDEYNVDQEDLIKVGKKILSEKNQEAERLAEENKQLRATIGDRDSTISSLNDQILHICKNSGDRTTGIALEAQAQRTLSMIKGYQRDIADAESRIVQSEEKNDALAAKNSLCDIKNENLRARLAESETAYKAVKKRATEQEEILEDQHKLIEKLMEDNARYVEANQKSK